MGCGGGATADAESAEDDAVDGGATVDSPGGGRKARGDILSIRTLVTSLDCRGAALSYTNAIQKMYAGTLRVDSTNNNDDDDGGGGPT